ncbi:hypothetical protein [Phaffia rhodozyma]|uniref:Uncharacterized protein n=1 Tax=Phaffia rhodozyma TaxID=264483 RepID=A0A0F7SEF8_PHARH|nr:hypothetical protein [Phaffia rhodozyma]
MPTGPGYTEPNPFRPPEGPQLGRRSFFSRGPTRGIRANVVGGKGNYLGLSAQAVPTIPSGAQWCRGKSFSFRFSLCGTPDAHPLPKRPLPFPFHVGPPGKSWASVADSIKGPTP